MTSKSLKSSEPSCVRRCMTVVSAAQKYIAIILAIIVYSCIGGKIFQILEEGTEEENCWIDKGKEAKVRVEALKAIW